MSENESRNYEGQREKQRLKPTLELYKPPVLRGEQLTQKRILNTEKRSHQELLIKDEAVAPNSQQPQKCKNLLSNLPEFVNEEIPQIDAKMKQSNFEEIIVELKKHLEKDCFNGISLASKIVPFPELTGQYAEFLVKYIIEDCDQKRHDRRRRGILTNIFMALAGTSVASDFCHGIVRALGRYFECRDELREDDEYFQVWLNFIALTYEFGQIAQEENIMQLIIDIFEYLLNEPILNTLKIAELESSLSLLMIIGRRMEFPAQLGTLKDLIRNAFLFASEAWTRKMLMLMVELGASEWKMKSDFEEYYFR